MLFIFKCKANFATIPVGHFIVRKNTMYSPITSIPLTFTSEANNKNVSFLLIINFTSTFTTVSPICRHALYKKLNRNISRINNITENCNMSQQKCHNSLPKDKNVL